MNADLRVAEARLVSRLISERAPSFVARCRDQWRASLSSDRDKPDDADRNPRIHIVCALSTFDDLHTSVGLTQLLEIPWVDATVILTLPTAVAARFFHRRAQEDGLHQLVHVIPSAELSRTVSKLNDDAVLCFVPPLAVLTAEYVQALQDVMVGRCEFRRDISQAGVFRAGAWRQGEGSFWNSGDQALAFPLLPLARFRSAEAFEDSCTVILHRFGAAVRKAAPAAPAGAKQPVRTLSCVSEGSRLNLHPSAASNGGELIIRSRTDDTQATRRIFCRRALGFLDEEVGLRLDPPLECVGERPLRAELLLRTETETCWLALSLQVPPSRLEPLMVTCYLNRGGAGNPMMRALAEGIGCGLRYAEDETGPRPGVPIVWGVLRGSDRVVAYAKQSGQYFFYVDHAYFNRGHGRNYRITRNAYEAGRVRRCPPDRLTAHEIMLKPWRQGGSSILVCPPTDYFMTAHDCHDWLEKTLEALKLHTDRPIVVRRKPGPGEPVEPLEDALLKAHALVTHSSNIAVEAVVAGIPVFVSPSSAAAPVGLTDLGRIEGPVYPDREAWLAHLAYSQFSIHEIRSGAAWRMLLEWEERDFV